MSSHQKRWRDPFERLADAIQTSAHARDCVRENQRGTDREMAREAYEHVVGDELAPAILAAIEDGLGEMKARDVERLAEAVWKRLSRTRAKR